MGLLLSDMELPHLCFQIKTNEYLLEDKYCFNLFRHIISITLYHKFYKFRIISIPLTLNYAQGNA
jgi:hypothetical protein